MTLKEIALELLGKYESEKLQVIYEFSFDPEAAEERLEEEIAEYQKAIEEATK
jgi:hypothetical protein